MPDGYAGYVKTLALHIKQDPPYPEAVSAGIQSLVRMMPNLRFTFIFDATYMLKPDVNTFGLSTLHLLGISTPFLLDQVPGLLITTCVQRLKLQDAYVDKRQHIMPSPQSSISLSFPQKVILPNLREIKIKQHTMAASESLHALSNWSIPSLYSLELYIWVGELDSLSFRHFLGAHGHLLRSITLVLQDDPMDLNDILPHCNNLHSIDIASAWYPTMGLTESHDSLEFFIARVWSSTRSMEIELGWLQSIRLVAQAFLPRLASIKLYDDNIPQASFYVGDNFVTVYDHDDVHNIYDEVETESQSTSLEYGGDA